MSKPVLICLPQWAIVLFVCLNGRLNWLVCLNRQLIWFVCLGDSFCLFA